MGMPVPANEVAERAERIRAALEADGGFALVAPTEHGEAPITAVHDAGPRPVPRGRLVGASGAGTRPPVPVGRHVPEPGDVRGHVRRTPSPSSSASRSTPAGGPASGASTRRRRWWPARTSRLARAVDVALTAADLVLAGAPAAYGLCRPPGHHAARSMYGGYCFFNNAAIAAEAIVRATGERVAILDVDYHHGNGSQQIFWRRGDVRYVSIHADPDRDYPYFLGRADETGRGRRGRGEPQHPAPAGDGQRGVPRCRRPGARGDRGGARLDRSSSRSGSTPTASTRSGRSR